MLVTRQSYSIKETRVGALVLLAIMLLFPILASAQGNLLITPRRVVFDGSTRSIDINLANAGQDTATYSISLVQIRMTEEGRFETITEPDPGQNFATRFIRFFPRSVTLGPNEAQTVKVQVTRRSQLDPGEYRSHFYFRAEANPAPLGEREVKSEDNSISVRLEPIFGITIPVIIRIGDLKSDISLTDLKLGITEQGQAILGMSFKRNGDKSVYGKLNVDYISPDGTSTTVGLANGIAVYTPNTLRRFNLSLINTEGIDFSSGKLVVTFSSLSDLDIEVFDMVELKLEK